MYFNNIITDQQCFHIKHFFTFFFFQIYIIYRQHADFMKKTKYAKHIISCIAILKHVYTARYSK